MRLALQNVEPDDNYRMYYKDLDSGRLYCWLCYGPRDRWVFYACTQDGEPSHEITPPSDHHKPGSAA